jgi:hypothetical protein
VFTCLLWRPASSSYIYLLHIPARKQGMEIGYLVFTIFKTSQVYFKNQFFIMPMHDY